jgi:amino acid adenylation domain-containing protein
VLEGEVVAPSSFSQRRLWILDRLYGQRASYIVSCPYRVSGPLDIARLQQSLDAIVHRHEALRTSFRLEGDDVVQVIRPDLSVPITVQDLGHIPQTGRFPAAVENVALEAARPFDLETGPLVRVRLYRLGEQDHLLALCFHHAIFDGWSEDVFLAELAALYDGRARDGTSETLRELPIQYRDFAVWQRETAADPAVQTSLEMWRERLTGAPAVLNLPLDHPRPGEPTRKGGQELLLLSQAQGDMLKAVGRRHGATLFMTLLAGYSVVLHRYSGDREVVIGTVLAGRTRVEIERLIGFFINTLALRVDLSHAPTFVALLDQIKHSSLEAYSHQDVPFERVVESLHPERSTGQMPFFQTIFVLQGGISRRLTVGNLSFEPLEIHNGTSKCDLVLSVGEAKDMREGLCCSLEYDADLFKPQTAARLLESFRCVLNAVSYDPEQPITSLPIVGPTDRALLERWSDTPAEYARESTIHRQFEAAAVRTPSAVAVTGESGSLTYAELDARSNRLAARLRREGVRKGELVGLCLERTIEAIVAELAVLKAGAGYLPLDPAYPASRLSFMLQDAGVRVVLSHTDASDRLPSGETSVIALDQEAGVIARESAERCADECGADDLAYVMYTSGSTGRPNGVRIPHRGVLRLVLGTDYVCWEKARTILQMAPLSFDASTFEVWGPLLHGRRLVLFPGRVPTVPILADVLRVEGVDCLWLPSALFNVVIDERPECLAGVSQLIVGGEALSVPHVRLAQARLSSTQLINGYGPTECTTFACCYPIPRVDDDDAGAIPIGRPIGNTSVLVLDARRQPVPIGVLGELYIGGDGVALGYHNRPQLTAERFVPDPTGKTAQLWYRTGDRARWNPEGVLEFHGRLDEQVKVRGFRVEPGEIEAACRRHPGVRDASVVVESQATGKRLVAFVVAEPGLALTAQDLSHSLAEQLPSHLVPADIAMVDALPLTPNGKVDRQALSSGHRSPGGGGPEQRRTEDPPARVAVAPRNATEEALFRIWRDLLRLDSVGVHDDFFALGGHSLLAVQMFSQIHDTFGRSLPFSSLVRHSTIAKLSALLASPAAPGDRSLSLVPLKETGSRPPLFLMPGIGNEVWTFLELAKHLDAEQPVYGVLPSEQTSNRAASLTDRVAAYVSDLEAFLPEGPFALGGHCSGAVTALEVARQLQARGKSVSLLVVFDHWLEETPVGILAFATNAVTWVADDLVRTPLRENLGRIRSRLRLLKTRLLHRGNGRTPPEDVRDLIGMWRYPDHEVDRLRQEVGALRAYRFGQYDGAIHVFRARTRALSNKHPTPDLGWKRVAAGRLSVETVPGSHDSMFRPPFVRVLGERLDAVLERTFHDAGTPSREVALR